MSTYPCCRHCDYPHGLPHGFPCPEKGCKGAVKNPEDERMEQ